MADHLSRRDFAKAAVLAASAASCGAVAAGDRNAQAESPPVPKDAPLKLGLMTYNLARDWDVETIIANCTEAKFQHAELRTTHAHGVEVTMSPTQRAEVKKRFEDSPLEAISLAGAFAYHTDDPAELRRNIEGTKEYTLLARDIGALGIRVFPNSLMTHKGIPEEQTLKQIGKSLGEVGDFAADYNVEIRVGVHGRETDDVPRIKKMLDYSGSRHVYVNWNCSPKDVTGEGFEANFQMVAAKITNVHMHDLYNEAYPYRKLFSLLKKSGYTGYCDAEISASTDPVRLMKYYRGLFLAYQDAI